MRVAGRQTQAPADGDPQHRAASEEAPGEGTPDSLQARHRPPERASARPVTTSQKKGHKPPTTTPPPPTRRHQEAYRGPPGNDTDAQPPRAPPPPDPEPQHTDGTEHKQKPPYPQEPPPHAKTQADRESESAPNKKSGTLHSHPQKRRETKNQLKPAPPNKTNIARLPAHKPRTSSSHPTGSSQKGRKQKATAANKTSKRDAPQRHRAPDTPPRGPRPPRHQTDKHPPTNPPPPPARTATTAHTRTDPTRPPHQPSHQHPGHETHHRKPPRPPQARASSSPTTPPRSKAKQKNRKQRPRRGGEKHEKQNGRAPTEDPPRTPHPAEAQTTHRARHRKNNPNKPPSSTGLPPNNQTIQPTTPRRNTRTPDIQDKERPLTLNTTPKHRQNRPNQANPRPQTPGTADQPCDAPRGPQHQARTRRPAQQVPERGRLSSLGTSTPEETRPREKGLAAPTL
ncbi:PREDICTED: basic salivary proline-rich protein 2-like [Elephantulus edwardii]|uniref:basic salivary proline-rich protein 2-like n=1 Tax=Elephantulus edwardii TaxID=28737 RepID=UPI0003F0B0DC|nr:PREDICTED: basic salivary proline-rich protein 2-like [Elephantulus edwardii]